MTRTQAATGRRRSRPHFYRQGIRQEYWPAPLAGDAGILLEYIREGDTVLVHSLDRLARNLVDLHDIVKNITDKKASITFVTENLTFTGDDAPLSILLLQVLGAFAQFQRMIIREAQREGIAIAKREGV